MAVRGLIIGGRFGEVIARQKTGKPFVLGELLIAKNEEETVLCQVYDLLFGSQVSQLNRELISGMQLEEETTFEFMEPHLRQYTVALLREMVSIKKQDNNLEVSLAKSLPGFFSELYDISKEDFSFLEKPAESLFLGNLRSGTSVVDVPIFLDAKKVLSHHVLIPATTGRGKSNLLQVLLWDLVDKDCSGTLVLDPHDEYYRPQKSLQLHPSKDKIKYFSNEPLAGTNSLVINVSHLRPDHFGGSASWSPAQLEALNAYYKKFGSSWIEEIIVGENKPSNNFHEGTLGVLQRRMTQLLGIEYLNDGFVENSIFSLTKGESTINEVVSNLEKAHTVVIDTSSFSGSVEILLGSIFTSEVLRRHKKYKQEGTLKEKPVISIVLEEAPRVIGKEVLAQGPNVFSSVAREGRKFQVGLIAITQLPSLIARDILANMNTKIVLGVEMRSERQAIIESASQDLSRDDRAIASLNKGEAIVTTNFSSFALPIKVPLFSEWIKDKVVKETPRAFSGLKE